MKKHIKTTAKLFTLLIICFVLNSCKPQSISILKNKISVASVTLYQDGEIFYTDNYLRFDFNTLMSPSELADIKSLLQVRATFMKDGVVIAKDIASGPFLVINSNSNEAEKGGSYSAYIFKSLKVGVRNLKKITSLDKLDYDSLNLIVVYPVMGGGLKYSSDVFIYTREELSNAISSSKSEVILIL